MTGFAVVLAVGMLVAFVLIRGYATKTLGELRLEHANLAAEERHLRLELEQAGVLQSSAETRRNQAQIDCQKLSAEMVDMATQLAEIEAQLKRPGDDEAVDEPPDAEADAP